MTVDKALQIITKTITNTIEEYDQSPESRYKDDQGVEQRKPHPLDIVDEDDKSFALDMALKDIALKAAPVSLIESSGSTASELRRISTDYFIRVPAEPVSGQNLDIDDGLSYAVTFKSLANIWRGYGEYDQKADSITNTYIQAYRKYLSDLIAGTIGQGAETYIRFSENGTDWHDSFSPADIYISFKKVDTDTWTPAIKFVGDSGADGQDGQDCADTSFAALQDTPAQYTDNGGKFVAVKATEDGIEFVDAPAGGGGASTFLDLTDTPAAFTADKWLKVNAAGDAIEQVDAPAGGGGTVTQFGDAVFFDDSSASPISLDAKVKNSFYLYPSNDLEIQFTKFDDGDNATASAWFGSIYTFVLVSNGSIAITFDANETILGDHSVALGTDSAGTNVTATILRMYYDGYGWMVASRTVLTDYNP